MTKYNYGIMPKGLTREQRQQFAACVDAFLEADKKHQEDLKRERDAWKNENCVFINGKWYHKDYCVLVDGEWHHKKEALN